MTTALMLTVLVTGHATYYAPGLMQRVAENRGMSLDGYAGGVALNDCANLGREVYLEFEGVGVLGPFLVVDCAQSQHMAAREDARYVVEVDASVAKEVGFYGVGPHPVRVGVLSDPFTIDQREMLEWAHNALSKARFWLRKAGETDAASQIDAVANYTESLLQSGWRGAK